MCRVWAEISDSLHIWVESLLLKWSVVSCHKSWLSKAPLIWLMLIGHKVCWLKDIKWLGSEYLTWVGNRHSLFCYDCCICLMLHNCELSEKITWHLTHIMSQGFHSGYSIKCQTCCIVFDWLMVCCAVTYMSHLMNFMLWLIISHRSYLTWADESSGLGTWRWLYKVSFGILEIGSSHNHLVTCPC